MEIYGHDHAMSVKANEIYRINSTYFLSQNTVNQIKWGQTTPQMSY